MKKWAFMMLCCVVLVAGACSSGGTGGSNATPDSVLPPVKASDKVEAEAKVAPVRWAALSFRMGGLVKTVNVKEGDAVKAGDVLAELDDVNIRLAVAQAEATLASTQAQLAQVKAGPRPAEIALSEQAVHQAEAAVAGAQAKLAQLKAGARSGDIAAAQADLARVTDQQKQLQKSYDEIIKAIEKYGVGGGPPEEQTRAALEAAKLATAAAQKRLNLVWAGATRAELDAAEADIAAAQARQARAQAQLDVLKAGATQEQIAVAEAGVKQAQVGVDTAQAQLDKLRLVAPFDGVLAAFDLKIGQLVSSGVPVVRLADLSAWQIETDDLTELSIVDVQVGQPAVVTFDAISGFELNGKVTRIKALGENKRGDIVYTVIVQPDQHDSRLRWNMTALVSIEPK